MAADTKSRLIQAGREAFIGRGYAASSIDEICEAASVTKGGFFHYFGSKQAFAGDVLTDTWTQFAAAHEAIGSLDPIERLEQHIDFMVGFIASDGRLIPTLAGEIGGAMPEIGQQIGGYFQTWTSFVRTALDEAGVDNPDSHLHFIISAIEGAPLVRGQLGDAVLDNTVQHLTTYVRSSLR